MKNLQDLTVQDYLRLVRRRLWYLIVPTILVSIGSAIYVWHLPSVYKSETAILVSDRLLPEDYIGSLVRQSVSDRIEFAKQQLRSRTFVERIAQEFQLVTGGADSDAILNTVISNTEITVISPNVFKVGFYSTDPNTAQAVARRLAERVMQSNTAFRQEKVTVADQFLDEQVRQASDELSDAEQKLNEFNRRHFPGVPPQGTTEEGVTALQTQLAAAQTDLQNALEQRRSYERSLAEHRDLKLAASSPAPVAPAPVIPAAESAAPPPDPAPSPAEQQLAQKRSELAALLARYTPQHPDVVRLTREVADLASRVGRAAPPKPPAPKPTVEAKAIPNVQPLPEVDISTDFYEAEVQRELNNLNREITRKEAAKNDLSNRVAIYARRLNMPADVMQELSGLTHTYELAKQRQAYLSTRKLNSDLAGRVDTDANNKTFTTVDPPNLPQTPVKPDRLTLTGLGCLAGLMVGFGAAFARELFDPTLTDEASAEAELKLSVLTSIPVVGDGPAERRLKKKAESKRGGLFRRKKKPVVLSSPEQIPSEPFSIHVMDANVREVALSPWTLATERFQMVRPELIVQRQKGIKTLIITSAVPDEGKTFVASCLAGILAKESGKRLLLVDADLRTANVSRVLGLTDRNVLPGLSDVLKGEADVENCLLPCSELNLTFLPAGRSADNPVELLSSPRLQQVMRDLKLLFDWVIVDSPPVMPIADAGLLVPVCDSAIVVVRADRTPASLVNGSIAKIGRERVSGIILNGVQNVKATDYYGYYYHQTAQARK